MIDLHQDYHQETDRDLPWWKVFLHIWACIANMCDFFGARGFPSLEGDPNSPEGRDQPATLALWNPNLAG